MIMNYNSYSSFLLVPCVATSRATLEYLADISVSNDERVADLMDELIPGIMFDIWCRATQSKGMYSNEDEDAFKDAYRESLALNGICFYDLVHDYLDQPSTYTAELRSRGYVFK